MELISGAHSLESCNSIYGKRSFMHGVIVINFLNITLESVYMYIYSLALADCTLGNIKQLFDYKQLSLLHPDK